MGDQINLLHAVSKDISFEMFCLKWRILSAFYTQLGSNLVWFLEQTIFITSFVPLL